MRRVSLALAVMSAVAVGCGGGAKPSSTSGAKGTAGSTFTLTVAIPGSGGSVVSGTLAADGVTFTADNKISCGGGNSQCSAITRGARLGSC